MKKLKKKDRPLSLAEWSTTTGAEVMAAGVDIEIRERLASKLDEEVLAAFQETSAAYHAYVCAHIASLMGRKA